jgi:hypothetical protein
MIIKRIVATMMVTLASAGALAQTASVTGTGMGLLQNDWIRAGVNTNTGTLGSGGGTSPGLLFDPAGTGTFNSSYDYLTPGSPFDGFSLKVDSTNKTNNNTGTAQIGKTSGLTLSNSDTTLSWSGASAYGGNDWSITNSYTLSVGKPYIDITSTITAGGAASNVYFAKFIDPDSQGMPGDSSSTDNVLGYGVIPSTNVAFSEATVSRYALGLYSAGTNVTAGVNGWNTDAASYNGTSYYKPLLDSSGNIQWTSPGCTNAAWGCPFVQELDASGNPVTANYGNSDDTIGLSFRWTGVTAGATLTASYAYIFGPSAFTAASSAVTGGAGGGTPGAVPGGGTLVDVGSATDAATSGSSGGGSSTPTVTGTSTVNGTPTIADSAGDAVVISTSLVAGNYLTRNYNSLTVTDTGRITTTPTTVVTTYSDSTTTSAAGTPVTVSERYMNSVDVTHADIATGSAIIGDIVRVSNGIDSASMVNSQQAPVTTNTGKGIVVTAGGVITANELYAVTTPTRFTYARTTTTVNANDFAPTSTYTDTSSTSTATSTVTGDYNVLTNDSIGRTANYAVSVGLRTDQIGTVSQLQSMINRNVEFGKTLTYKYYDHNRDGYRGYSTLLGVGHAKDIAGGMNLGLGINKIDTRLSGNASSVNSETVQLGATLSKKDVKGFDLSGTVQHSMTDYNVSAAPTVNITGTGDARLLAAQAFNNSLPSVTGKTRGQDTSVSVRAVGPAFGPDEMFRPVVGATYGQRSANGYTANIAVLPGVTVSNRVNTLNQDYGYATAGVVAKKGIFNATALRHTDGVNQYGVGLSKEQGDLTFNVRADRLETSQGGTNVYGANMVYRF